MVELQRYQIKGSSTFQDIAGLDPEVQYHLGVYLQPQGASSIDTGMSLAVKTCMFALMILHIICLTFVPCTDEGLINK